MKKKAGKRFLQGTLIVGTIISLFYVPWILVYAWILPLPNSLQEQANEAVDLGFTGVIVYVDQGNEPPQVYTSGWHNRQTKKPTQPDALFKIASISKLYDAAAATRLIYNKQLDANKTIYDYLPELAQHIENTDKITLKWLIQHKSGLPNFTDSPNYWSHPTTSFEESIALISGQPAQFEPGTDYEYCNTNYLILSEIMDKTLGYSHYDFIRKEILNPLELKHTFHSLQEVDTAQLMSGYHLGHPHDLKLDDLSMVATAQDVGQFVKALNKGSLFTAEEQELYSSLYPFQHSGWVPGYQSFATYYKDLDATVVTFYNTTDADLIYWNLAEIMNNRIAKIIRKSSASV